MISTLLPQKQLEVIEDGGPPNLVRQVTIDAEVLQKSPAQIKDCDAPSMTMARFDQYTIKKEILCLAEERHVRYQQISDPINQTETRNNNNQNTPSTVQSHFTWRVRYPPAPMMYHRRDSPVPFFHCCVGEAC